MAEHKTIPEREDVKKEYCWNLDSLFKSEDDWEKGLKDLEKIIPKIGEYKGTLGESAGKLAECLHFMNDLELLAERLGYYAHLRSAENVGDSKRQERFARYMRAASQAQAASSYQIPEIQAIPDEEMAAFLKTEELKEFTIVLKKILRFKPHILSENEERLLAMQAESNQTPQKTFSVLTNSDMDFGEIETEEGKIPLTQSTYSVFMENPDRKIREKAYHQFMKGYEDHKQTLSCLYGGSVQQDIYQARVRNYSSARFKSLFKDDVDESVYDNLISAVTEALPDLYAYYELRREVLGLDELHLYDTKTALVKDVKLVTPYEEGVDIVCEALKPLGDEYRDVMKKGLLGGWVDRYENKGKRSGAFSAGSYAGDPYILLNYQDESIRDLFTLAHEAGHSMHSWYSVKNNPFQHYSYTIFEAEVASTFNEQFLADYLLKKAETKEMKAYLIGKLVDDIIATIFRQTMFAEYEYICHDMVEKGIPLTEESLRSEYRKLLEKYFGPKVVLEDTSDLEGLRVPHFYSAFYVYKYATGLSAAIALSERVKTGGDKEREDYLSFLKSGGSRFPIEALKVAGVDMSKPEPVKNALKVFARLVQKLRELLV